MIGAKKVGTYENAQRPLSMHPNKFSLWLFMITVVMLFAAFTSAYMVRSAERDWMKFQLPMIFLFNTGVLLISSVSMHFAYIYAKKDEIQKVKYAVLTTIFLGLLFMVLQMTAAWNSLMDIKIYLGGIESNPAGSFVYVFFIVHVLHLIAGVCFLIYLYMETVKFKVHSKNMLQMEMSATFLALLRFALGIFICIFVNQ